jgi:polyisoprenyl-teichoic acid--peptidoglycan teichoic acid transferase
VKIAGTRHYGKINGAYATGGVARAEATVSAFLDDLPIDKYVVLKIDATKKLVDAVGGVDINVEKDMDYDDNWGHLHIHLKKGLQHLNGEDAVGYIRFRHDRDGDFGRIRRQQQLLHTVVEQMKTPAGVLELPRVEDAVKQSVMTNLSNEQIGALASLFRGLNPSNIVTAYVPGTNQRINGVWFLTPDEDRKDLLVDWLLRGNPAAEIALIHVSVQDGCGNREAARQVKDSLRAAGFNADLDGEADRSDYATSQVIDFDQLKGAGALVASKLGTPTSPLVQPDPQADTNVEVIVGRDLNLSTVASRATGP